MLSITAKFALLEKAGYKQDKGIWKKPALHRGKGWMWEIDVLLNGNEVAYLYDPYGRLQKTVPVDWESFTEAS